LPLDPRFRAPLGPAEVPEHAVPAGAVA